MPGDSEKYLGAAVGALTGNPFYGALAGGVGSGTSGALTGGAAGAMGGYRGDPVGREAAIAGRGGDR